VKPSGIDTEAVELRRFGINRILNIGALFRLKADNAKYEIGKHCGEVRMTPLKTAEGQRFYEGTEKWNPIGFIAGGNSPPLPMAEGDLKRVFESHAVDKQITNHSSNGINC